MGIDYLERFGITTLWPTTTWTRTATCSPMLYQPLALGGITDGVVNLELTGAYAALANGGNYIKPKFYSRIEDSQGNVILDNTSEETRVVKDTTAFLITKAMEDVIKSPEGTANGSISLATCR